MSLHLRMTPWGRFRAEYDASRAQRWLGEVGDAAEKVFKGGMKGYPPASAPGAYPNIRSGGLRGSIRKVVPSSSVEIGTSMHYSGYLAHGTRKMAKRKMSKEALQEAIPKVRGKLKDFARWRRG